ncbi:endonuclease/exonuclease/phosphatase (EEP) superfamily protein YafD [Amorphus suaedae]
MTGWFIDSSLNFLPHIVCGIAALLTIVALVLRRRSPLVVAAALVVCLGVGLALYKATLTAPGTTGGLRVMTANLLFSNTDVPAFVLSVRANDPDLLVVQERVPFWTDAIDRTLGAEYALIASSPANTTNMYLRKARQTCPVPELRTPIAENAALGCVVIDGLAVLVLGVHAPRAKDEQAGVERSTSLAAYRATLGEAQMPRIVAGDFNASPLAPSMADFMRQTAVAMPAEGGVWFSASWPAVAPAVGVRIDHVLVSREMAAQLVAVGPPIGSDHLPVTVDVSLRPR